MKSIDADPIRISLKAMTPSCKRGTCIYLRKRAEKIEFTPLFGPGSNSRFSAGPDRYTSVGNWNGVSFEVRLVLSKERPGWKWQVDLTNDSGEALELDLVHLQDAGLKPLNAGLINEYYVSQYLDRRILHDPVYGAVACCRQNMRESTGHPWFMLACGNGALSASTDGIQFYGRSFRETGVPEALARESMEGECAGESSVFTLQEKPFRLAPGEKHRSVFCGYYLADHPDAISPADLEILPLIFSELDDEMESRFSEMSSQSNSNIFHTAPLLPVDDLTPDEVTAYFGSDRRHIETENDSLLSFFYKEYEHVVLKAKEIRTDRPHGLILQAGAGTEPSEAIVSTTAFAFGVFNSHISQGNTNFNVLLSVCTSQFNQSPGTGQRIFVEMDGQLFLLGTPSAFEMGLNHCRWIYKHRNRCLQVRTWTSKNAPQVNMDFSVLSGDRVKLKVTHDFDPLNGWSVVPGSSSRECAANPRQGSMILDKFPHARFRIVIRGHAASCTFAGDEALYDDRKSRGEKFFVIETGTIGQFSMSFVGEVPGRKDDILFTDAEQQFLADRRDALTAWKELCLGLELSGNQKDISAIREILPWYGQNALTHFLTPYGLEQFSGAAWGTRDVAQGPVELLLTLERHSEARKVLRTIFSNQNPDGGWPQWWMFDAYRQIRAGDSHGDVFYWCLMALGNYIRVTGDLAILDEQLPYYHYDGPYASEKTPLREHAERLIKMIVSSFIPGTSLVPFGGGDWNDSLQPVSHELASRMISSWTVEMNYQAFDNYSHVYEKAGETGKAGELRSICEKIRSDFNKYLVKDGVVAGYGLVNEDGRISVLLHPSDKKTGITYSLLPMERGILSGIFTSGQAVAHQALIEEHLKGPDGARLMDRPLRYKGGVQEIFQRAESSTFFGREIGLMYIHEHIRYAESLAITGKADAFVKALRQAIPVDYREIVKTGDLRQANCYYSSSDVTFRNRRESDELYGDVTGGKMTLRGGWRVYSSGPGIFIGLVVTKLLGIRLESDRVVIDPVMPKSLDGLSACITLKGIRTTFIYRVKEEEYCPKAILINGKALPFGREENLYRAGGAVISLADFFSSLNRSHNVVVVEL